MPKNKGLLKDKKIKVKKKSPDVDSPESEWFLHIHENQHSF